jgi:mannosyl-3-phosphoglycerate phosphatase
MAGTRQRGVNRVIYTDLDGSLIDHHTYSYEVTQPLVSKLNTAGIPLVFVSSKTRAEQEVYRRGLGVTGPFIAENGGAIFIPRGYFNFPYDYQREVAGYRVIELAKPYAEIRQKLEVIREKYGLSLRGYGDMDTAEVARITGLDMAQAGLAKKREYQETLNLTGSEEEIEVALTHITEAGLGYSRGGRFYGVMAGSDKGRAVRMLTAMFRQKLGRVETIGIGDSGNDMPMLAAVDRPVLVQKPGGLWHETALANLYRVEGIGPQGWVRAVVELTEV